MLLVQADFHCVFCFDGLFSSQVDSVQTIFRVHLVYLLKSDGRKRSHLQLFFTEVDFIRLYCMLRMEDLFLLIVLEAQQCAYPTFVSNNQLRK